jgi:hypothetical protein
LNHKQYIDFRDAYRIRTDGNETTLDKYDILSGSGEVPYSEQRLLIFRDQYKRDRDFYYIVSTLIYGLNIIDAYVFAHLKDFDIDENLSFKPTLNLNPNFAVFQTGFRLNYSF